MKVIEHLDRATEPIISYEIIPPKRGGSIEGIFNTIEQIIPYKPPFIDVTSHAAEVELEEQSSGVFQRRVKRKRPGTIGLCAAITHHFKIDTVPHLLCQGFTRQETEDALIELHYLGIENVLAIRGDDTGYEKKLMNGRTRNEYAVDLVQQIDAMNHGKYLEDLVDATPTDFCIGVGGYPERHHEAPNLRWDIQRTKEKVDAGANYLATQMFFQNEYFFQYEKLCREAGITVPIIPGLKILTSRRHLTSLPRFFHVEVPEELAVAVENASDKQVEEIGVEWAIRQSLELLEYGVPAIHFYIMQNSDVVTRVLDGILDKKNIFAISE